VESLPDPDKPSVAEVLEDIRAATVDQPSEQITGAVETELPDSGSQAASATTATGTLTMDIPAHGPDLARAGDDVAVFDGTAPDTEVAVEDTPQGLRALVHIDSPEAPERFDFPIGGDVSTLRLTEDGGATALNQLGEVVAVAAAPWASDADGIPVPTHYEINGTTLTQVVEHHAGDYAYGIVADPAWWDVTRCVLAIGWVLGSTVFAATKITKIRAAIRGLGGITEAAKLLVGATSWAEKAQALGGAGATAAAYFMGIDTILNNC
jgi:hypothetical protein